MIIYHNILKKAFRERMEHVSVTKRKTDFERDNYSDTKTKADYDSDNRYDLSSVQLAAKRSDIMEAR